MRVPDKDQRVWNDDDDDDITEEMLYDIQNEYREDMDDDYEPTTHRSSYDPYQDVSSEKYIESFSYQYPPGDPIGSHATQSI